MKSYLNLILSLTLLELAYQCNAQNSNRFIVNILNRITNETVCVGTVFTRRHILVPATCAFGSQISVQIQGDTSICKKTFKND